MTTPPWLSFFDGTPGSHRRPLMILVAALLALFLVGVNLAWTNPRPDVGPTFRPFGETPLLWQYDADAWFNFWSAVYFPGYFHIAPARIDRPVSLAVNKAVGEVLYLLLAPFSPAGGETPGVMAAPGRLVLAMALAHLITKFLLLLAGGWALFRLLRPWVEEPLALMGVLVFLFHPWVVYNLPHFHQYEFQLVNPVLFTAFLVILVQREKMGLSLRRPLLLYAVVAGALLLAKTTLAVWLAVLAVALLLGRFGALAAAVAAPLVLYGGYRLLLWAEGVPWWSLAVDGYGQGSLVIDLLREQGMAGLAVFLAGALVRFAARLVEFHSVWLPAAAVGWWLLARRAWGDGVGEVRVHWAWPLFVLLVLGGTFAQSAASNRLYPYMTVDAWFVTVGLAMLAAREVLRRGWARLPWLWALTLVWMFYGVAAQVHLPWQSPAQQIGVAVRELS